MSFVFWEVEGAAWYAGSWAEVWEESTGWNTRVPASATGCTHSAAGDFWGDGGAGSWAGVWEESTGWNTGFDDGVSASSTGSDRAAAFSYKWYRSL